MMSERALTSQGSLRLDSMSGRHPEVWSSTYLLLCSSRVLDARLPSDLYYRCWGMAPTQIMSPEREGPNLGLLHIPQQSQIRCPDHSMYYINVWQVYLEAG